MKFFWGHFLLLILAVTALLVGGCASAPPSPNDKLGKDFKAEVTSNQNPVPVPAEIATDIYQIARGGRPTRKRVVTRVREEEYDGEEEDSDEEVEYVPSRHVVHNHAKAPRPRNVAATPAPTPKSYHKTRSLAQVVSGKTEEYQVKKGDTLMKISFEKYGDLFRWREIYEANRDKIPDLNALASGTVLKIQGVEYVVIRKNGEPYLIRRQDTLVKISSKLYGTTSKWKDLWHNNPELIKDPNKIYAGLTMYYVPDKELSNRVPASAKGKVKKTHPKKKKKSVAEAKAPADNRLPKPKENLEAAASPTTSPLAPVGGTSSAAETLKPVATEKSIDTVTPVAAEATTPGDAVMPPEPGPTPASIPAQ